VFIVLGSAISLAYYLRVIAAVWMRAPSEGESRLAALTTGRGGDPSRRPIMAGGSIEADAEDAARAEQPLGTRLAQPEVIAVALVCAAATIFFGIYPSPLFDVARDAGSALVNLV
jgi:NADH-quinone oxidoreductase subunit N